MTTPTTDTTPAPRIGAPVVPILETALHPIGVESVRLDGGVWGDWQAENARVSVPHSVEWLERDGSVDNLRRLAPGATGFDERRGLWFTDSDVYKLLEGIGWDLGRAGGEGEVAAMTAIADELIAVTAAAQLDDGYLNSFVQAGLDERWENLQKSHELYCMGHLIQAAVAHHRTTGSSSLLDTAVKAADCIVRDFGDGRRAESDGHEEIEMALVELYRVTGTRAYLDVAKQFIDGRGYGVFQPSPGFHVDADYLQDATPVRQETTAVGHAVRAVYLMAGAVDVAVETSDAELLAAIVRQWESMVATKMYVTGALGSRAVGEAFGDEFELPQDIGYGETCATIGNMMLSWRLLLATGEARYAELIERSLFNLFAASTSVSRDSFFYSNPGQRRAALPAAPTDRRPDRADAPGTRPTWFACACCPPNIVRTVSSLGAYAVTHTDSGVQLQQFFPGTFIVDGSFGEVVLEVSTEYPLDGRVSIVVTGAGSWTLSLRRPSWAVGATVSVNGADAGAVDQGGYLLVSRSWADGDVVELMLPMTPRLTVGHPSIDAVRGTVAVERGPVVYALESHDQPDGVDLESVQFDAAIALHESEGSVAGQRTVLVHGRGVVPSTDAFAGSAWVDRSAVSDVAGGREVELTFIPYALWANRGPSLMRVHVPEFRR